jgi:WD40 repeat protein
MVQVLTQTHPTKKHSEFVTGVSWSSTNELVSVADDKKVWLWNVEGEPQQLLLDTDTFCTEVRWSRRWAAVARARRSSSSAVLDVPSVCWGRDRAKAGSTASVTACHRCGILMQR